MEEKRRVFVTTIHLIFVPLWLTCYFIAALTNKHDMFLISPYKWVGIGLILSIISVIIINNYTYKRFYYSDVKKKLKLKDKYKDNDLKL